MALSSLVSCVLADPLPDDAPPPTRRPAIAHGSVIPPTSPTILELPEQFIVPVDLSNPRVPYAWRVFVDYDPDAAPERSLVLTSAVQGSVSAPNRQTVNFSIDRHLWRGPCHRIELMVALEFVGVHEAGPAGYDSVTWFYAPSGNFAACAEEGDSGALVGAVE